MMIKEAIAIFKRSYLAGFDKLFLEPALFAAAATPFELRRTAVYKRCRGRKVNLARRKMPIARDGRSAILSPTD
jgi:hypothetical protein